MHAYITTVAALAGEMAGMRYLAEDLATYAFWNLA